MNTYIVTYADEHDNIRAVLVDAYDIINACCSINCRAEDIISAMRIYNRIEEE